MPSLKDGLKTMKVTNAVPRAASTIHDQQRIRLDLSHATTFTSNVYGEMFARTLEAFRQIHYLEQNGLLDMDNVWTTLSIELVFTSCSSLASSNLWTAPGRCGTITDWAERDKTPVAVYELSRQADQAVTFLPEGVRVIFNFLFKGVTFSPKMRGV
ncbi:hypothetical protein C8R47DRAFT_1067698 [Mycena vitilis]|nr:hypothetical protein C8R47DRAFT_1067698 [Mycena vitilis]